MPLWVAVTGVVVAVMLCVIVASLGAVRLKARLWAVQKAVPRCVRLTRNIPIDNLSVVDEEKFPLLNFRHHLVRNVAQRPRIYSVTDIVRQHDWIGQFTAFILVVPRDISLAPLVPISVIGENLTWRSSLINDIYGIPFMGKDDPDHQVGALRFEENLRLKQCGIGSILGGISRLSGNSCLTDQDDNAENGTSDAEDCRPQIGAVKRIVSGIIGVVLFGSSLWLAYYKAVNADLGWRVAGWVGLFVVCFYLAIPFVDTGVFGSTIWIWMLKGACK